MFNEEHISLKVPLKLLPSSTTITAQVPNVRNTFSMNSLAKWTAVMLNVGVEMMNCVRSHNVFMRYPVRPCLSLTAVPGLQRSTCMIQKGAVIGQEKYNSLFRLRQMWYETQCAHLATHSLMSSRIRGQKNRLRNLYRVLYTPMCPPLGLA